MTFAFRTRFAALTDGMTNVLPLGVFECAVILLPDCFCSYSHAGLGFFPKSPCAWCEARVDGGTIEKELKNKIPSDR